MKHLIMLILVTLSLSLHASESLISEIDDFETAPNYIEVSEEGLPQEYYLELLQQMGLFRFTLLSDEYVNTFFESMKKNRQARMKVPGGSCSYRRAYVQKKLKALKTISGKLVLHCPTNNGRLRLKDRSSGRYYTFSNFHDANIVAVNTPNGPDFRVMDVQFEDTPLTLQAYLSEIETYQRIKPLKRKGSTTSKGTCYWSITTPYLKYKSMQ